MQKPALTQDQQNSDKPINLKIIKSLSLSLLGLIFVLWLVTFLSLRFESHEYSVLSPEQQSIADLYFKKSFEPLPHDWRWSTYSPAPGVELRTGRLTIENPKGTVIVVPGFTSPIEMSARAYKMFSAAGFNVAAIDYRGQGKSWRPLSNPEKGHVESFAQLADDLAGFAKQERVADTPLFFFSISKGAHITMRMAEDNIANASAYALAVPMIEINSGGFDLSRLKFIAQTFTTLGLGSMYLPGLTQWPNDNLTFGEATDCNANPTTAQIQDSLFAQDKQLRVNGVTMRWLKESIESGEHLLRPEVAEKIVQPVKVFNAGDEQIVNAAAAKQFCESLANCSFSEFANARHCINRENYSVFDEILKQSIELYKAQL